VLALHLQKFCCNGTIVADTELGQVIQLQGDQRTNISKFLVDEGICEKASVKIHGF
jgi:translation initiation factor 1